ncbi:MAG: hypothetical protein M1822_009134 [Bathelium mastoideum]|nr:MAG: hypothetical protein M1822_009134 [Bathelium mastoideum]
MAFDMPSVFPHTVSDEDASSSECSAGDVAIESFMHNDFFDDGDHSASTSVPISTQLQHTSQAANHHTSDVAAGTPSTVEQEPGQSHNLALLPLPQALNALAEVLTLEDLLPRVMILQEERQDGPLIWEDELDGSLFDGNQFGGFLLDGSESVGQANLLSVQGTNNNGSLPPQANARSAIARFIRRSQRQLRYMNLRFGHVNPWLQDFLNLSRPSKPWRPSALIMYQRAPGQPDASGTPAETSYLPLHLYKPRNADPMAPPLIIPFHVKDTLPAPRMSNESTSSRHWPQGRLAVELFENIADYLSRDDIKNTRLVSKEFDNFVSAVLFRSAVVPFNTEIYDMIEPQNTAGPDPKGKGKASDLKLHWENPQKDDENKVYKGYGLQVFRGFGGRIYRFGMSFEVEEDALARPPKKNALEPHVSFWGPYEWPHEQYHRYADRAGLEQAADETSKMKQAFSHLERTQQLALSVDSGLGWLRGPDVSMHSQVFKQPPPVFGSSSRFPNKIYQEQCNLWKALVLSCQGSGLDRSALRTSVLCRKDITQPLNEIPTISTGSYADPSGWPVMEDRIVTDSATESMYHKGKNTSAPASSLGLLYAHPSPDWEGDEMLAFRNHPINPKRLTKEQKEWLLETEWAQRAFMMSYLLAVIDNPNTFARVRSLNLARISSRYVQFLNRADFWAALPQLGHVIIKVIPDWRNVGKDRAGYVDTQAIDPSDACEPFNRLLVERIQGLESVTSLTLGWIGGGEYAEGMFARNQHLLPAPILVHTKPLSARKDNVITFPYVKHLVLVNCWITPPAIFALVEQSRTLALEKLAFVSVSLTVNPEAPPAPNGPGNAQVGNQHVAQVLQAFQPAQHAHWQAAAQWLAAQHQQAGAGAAQPMNFANAMPAWAGNQWAIHPPNQNFAPAGPVNQGFFQAAQNHHQWTQQQLAQQQWAQQQLAQQQWAQQQWAQQQLNQQQWFQQQWNQQQWAQQQWAQQQWAQHQWNQQQWNQQQWAQQQFAPGVQAPQWPAPGQQAQPAFNPPANPPANPPVNNNANHNNTNRFSFRGGSWPNVINQITPGRTFADVTNAVDDNEAKTIPAKPRSYLRSLVFRSCGYCRLPDVSFDQACLEPSERHTLADPVAHHYQRRRADSADNNDDGHGHGHRGRDGGGGGGPPHPAGPGGDPSYPKRGSPDSFFTRRAAALAPLMMTSRDPLLGTVVQHMSQEEYDALRLMWGLKRPHWRNSESVMFDGWLRGGTGRFGGEILVEEGGEEGAEGMEDESVTVGRV